MIEGSEAGGVAAAGESLLANDALQRMGAKPEVTRGLYQLEYSIPRLW
jgi:hypothetical protein